MIRMPFESWDMANRRSRRMAVIEDGYTQQPPPGILIPYYKGKFDIGGFPQERRQRYTQSRQLLSRCGKLNHLPAVLGRNMVRAHSKTGWHIELDYLGHEITTPG